MQYGVPPPHAEYRGHEHLAITPPATRLPSVAGRRALAAMIDLAIAGGVGWLLARSAGTTTGWAVAGSLALVYPLLSEASTGGLTAGKWIGGVRTSAAEGTQLTLRQVVARNLGPRG